RCASEVWQALHARSHQSSDHAPEAFARKAEPSCQHGSRKPSEVHSREESCGRVVCGFRRTHCHRSHNRSEDLQHSFPRKPKAQFWSHGSISQKTLKTSVDKLKALYQDVGYEQVKVTPKVVDHEPNLDVLFQIEEGPQTWVDAVEVTGNQTVSLSRLTGGKPLPLRPSYPFSQRRMAEGRNLLSAAYQSNGYLNAEVKANVARDPSDPHHVQITYAIV